MSSNGSPSRLRAAATRRESEGTEDRPVGSLGLLRSLHRALRLGAALRAYVADVIQFPGDWHDTPGLHGISASGASDNRQGFWRFAIHSAIPEINVREANSRFVAFSSN
jgi:hypothetical protein